MKYKKYFVMFILFFVCFSNKVFAKSGVIDADVLYFRSNTDASNGNSIIRGLTYGTKVEILNTNSGSNAYCGKWYQIKHNGTTGYACGTYITLIPDNLKLTGSDNIYIRSNYNDKVAGDGTVACYGNTSSINLLNSPGGNNNGNKVSCGDVISIKSVKEEVHGTCSYYYDILTSTGASGYICGSLINTTKLSETATKYYQEKEKLEDYYKLLRERNFPDSYLTYLAEIHARHPNWQFYGEKINLDFDTVVSNESFYGRSLLEGSAFSNNYFSMDINSYSIINDTFYQYATERGWYNASSEAIAYYLDPRNYLNEKYIFAFESLNFNDTHTADTIAMVLSGQSFWTEVYKDLESNVYDDVITATKEVGISSVHVASRIKQEISGIDITDPRLGGVFTYNDTEYSKFYNFFNIKVYGENKILNGMVYAMENGWNTPYNGILGGAKFIYNGYISVNQDTVYYQKFDVSTADGHYTHQYMQNLAAPMQETSITYNTYVNNMKDYLDTSINFVIPVYNNMPNYAVSSPRVGNPNNYLSSISIDDKVIDEFDYTTQEYNIEVFNSKINIKANPINSKAKASGIGNIELKNENNKVNIIVMSESGRSRTYTLNITKKKTEEIVEIPLSEVLNNSGIKYNDKYIYGISPNTNVNSLIDNIKKISATTSITIKNSNNEVKSNTNFTTGDVVEVSNSKEKKTYQVIIYGDINGDGVIDKLDYLAVLRHYYNYAKLEGVYSSSADVNRDGVIDKLDYLAILRDYYGYAKIEQ